MTQSRTVVIANWKMHFTLPESVARAQRLRELWESISKPVGIHCIVCPSFDALSALAEMFRGSNIALGAQDVFWQDRGSYTGEVSPRGLVAVGATHVIIGHSERRGILHEDDILVNQKVHAALRAGLTPILCVGETSEERSNGLSDRVVARQVIQGLQGIVLGEREELIIAYEPVWVIGTGHAVAPDDAMHAAHVIEQALIDLQPPVMLSQHTRIIYGGSAEEGNIRDFLRPPLITGALVGTASLEPERFINLIRAIL